MHEIYWAYAGLTPNPDVVHLAHLSAGTQTSVRHWRRSPYPWHMQSLHSNRQSDPAFRAAHRIHFHREVSSLHKQNKYSALPPAPPAQNPTIPNPQHKADASHMLNTDTNPVTETIVTN